MSTNLNLLKLVMARMEENRESMAFFLKTYEKIEHKSESELVSNWKCSAVDYCKLALCNVPDVNAADYVQRLNTISEYTHIMAEDINTVIKKVNSWLKFSKAPGGNTSIGMAARDKKKKKDDPQ